LKHICALAVVLIAAPAGAADSPPPVAKPVAALQQCRTLADSAARLACYDKAVDALTAATASNDVVIVERTEVRKARKGLFGFTLPRIGFLTGKPDNAEDRADEAELETTITAARGIGYGKWRFTVEGGATWETTEANMGFNDPLPGRKVLLQKGSLGGYFATVGKGRRVAAKRIS
jgi:hypothetical protein